MLKWDTHDPAIARHGVKIDRLYIRFLTGGLIKQTRIDAAVDPDIAYVTESQHQRIALFVVCQVSISTFFTSGAFPFRYIFIPWRTLILMAAP